MVHKPVWFLFDQDSPPVKKNQCIIQTETLEMTNTSAFVMYGIAIHHIEQHCKLSSWGPVVGCSLDLWSKHTLTFISLIQPNTCSPVYFTSIARGNTSLLSCIGQFHSFINFFKLNLVATPNSFNYRDIISCKLIEVAFTQKYSKIKYACGSDGPIFAADVGLQLLDQSPPQQHRRWVDRLWNYSSASMLLLTLSIGCIRVAQSSVRALDVWINTQLHEQSFQPHYYQAVNI